MNDLKTEHLLPVSGAGRTGPAAHATLIPGSLSCRSFSFAVTRLRPSAFSGSARNVRTKRKGKAKVK